MDSNLVFALLAESLLIGITPDDLFRILINIPSILLWGSERADLLLMTDLGTNFRVGYTLVLKCLRRRGMLEELRNYWKMVYTSFVTSDKCPDILKDSGGSYFLSCPLLSHFPSCDKSRIQALSPPF